MESLIQSLSISCKFQESSYFYYLYLFRSSQDALQYGCLLLFALTMNEICSLQTTSWHRGLFLSLRTHPSPPTPPDPRRSGLFTIENCIKIDSYSCISFNLSLSSIII
ncbi:hypothetical protein E1A91_A12G065400v1 [Gossypium mustelinum]|uniref:Uncharacterized protein n=1 Tax=Gossypium mustelinum TaxID=34275 RepID=A0A5D2WQJ6_GOSMU|nr:hypothetical protein E1A91_A12G065400v1 [Gossypium mustelinum]